MTRFYYRDCALGIFVYDISDYRSFASIERWIGDFQSECPEAIIIIAGNKCDKIDGRQVAFKEVETFARERGMGFIECSAKDGNNVSTLFELAATQLWSRRNWESTSLRAMSDFNER